MPRYYGNIGFQQQVETAPGVWREKIVERQYRGEITRNQLRWNSGSEMNDDLRIDNAISIVFDPYLEQHISSIRYVTWMGSKWKVTSLSIQRPRVVLQLGGLYNDQS